MLPLKLLKQGRKNNMKKIISILFLITVISSCMVGPKYTRPEMKSMKSWSTKSSFLDTVAADSITNLKWFKLFNDPVLNKLINQALAGNYNMANAVLRIQK